MTNKHVRNSASFASKEMQIKTTRRHNVTLMNKAVVRGQIMTSVVEGGGELSTVTHYWWECKTVWPLWKTLALPQRVKHRDST